MNLNNSTVLITGGTSGIGLEFVKQLIQQNANIIITGRDLTKLDQAKRQFPQIHTFQSDVSNPKDIEKLYQNVTSQFPQLNIIINNAGIMRNMDLQDTSMSLEDITREIDTNLSGTIRMAHQFLPHLKTMKNAAIVNVSSGLAFVPLSISPVYCATKAGVHSYSQSLRLQLKNTSIKVFELAPPGTETPLMDEFTGIVDSNQNMKVDKMVSIAIKGILKDKLEIRPGLSNVLKIMSRVAPNFIANMLHQTTEKAKKKLN
jgi:uncharacterized oxidoreductase